MWVWYLSLSNNSHRFTGRFLSVSYFPFVLHVQLREKVLSLSIFQLNSKTYFIFLSSELRDHSILSSKKKKINFILQQLFWYTYLSIVMSDRHCIQFCARTRSLRFQFFLSNNRKSQKSYLMLSNTFVVIVGEIQCSTKLYFSIKNKYSCWKMYWLKFFFLNKKTINTYLITLIE